MLITRWHRIRSLSCASSGSLERYVQRAFHDTPTLFYTATSRGPTVQPLYIDTVPPTQDQLNASEVFFKTHLPTKSWTATEWRQQPHSESAYLIPEVAFLGRSNSGKSSLLNGLLFDNELCRVGAKPGKTITMHAWSLSPIDPKSRGARKGYQGDTEPKLTVLDMPGYGHGSHGEWGAAIMKYLTTRRQLRRAFVLVNPLHGLKEQDLQMLELLRSHGIPHQLIACKADRMKGTEAPTLLGGMQAQIDRHFSKRKQIPLLVTIKDILTVGGLAQVKDSSKWLDSAQGLHDVRWAVLRATGLEEYATVLAAHGGKMPRIKGAHPTLPSQDVPSTDHHATPQPTNSEPPTQQHSHATNFTDETTYHDHFPTSPMQQQHNKPPIPPAFETLTSEIFSPLSSSPSSTTTHQPLESPRERPPRVHHRAGPAARTSRPPAKIPDGRITRTKDVKRYGGRSPR